MRSKLQIQAGIIILIILVISCCADRESGGTKGHLTNGEYKQMLAENDFNKWRSKRIENKIIEAERKINEKREKEMDNLKRNVEQRPKDVFTKSKLTDAQLNIMLEDTTFNGQGYLFKRIEDKYNVNAVFCISVMEFESDYGKCIAQIANYYGLKDIKGDWMRFNSSEACVDFFGALMDKQYRGMDIYHIGKRYCENGVFWANNVIKLMDENYNKLKEIYKM